MRGSEGSDEGCEEILHSFLDVAWHFGVRFQQLVQELGRLADKTKQQFDVPCDVGLGLRHRQATCDFTSLDDSHRRAFLLDFHIRVFVHLRRMHFCRRS